MSLLGIYEVNASKPVKIGRDSAQCSIALPETAAGVSRVHAVLHLKNNELVLLDQSTHGTCVNGEKVLKTSRVLSEGDVVVFGQHEFRINKESAKSVFSSMNPSQRSDGIQNETSFVQKRRRELSSTNAPPNVDTTTHSQFLSRKRTAVSGKEQSTKQSKISSFFGGRTKRISQLHEIDGNIIAQETPGCELGLGVESERSNTSLVEDSQAVGSRLLRGGPVVLCSSDREETVLAADTPAIVDRVLANSPHRNTSIIGDSVGVSEPGPSRCTSTIRGTNFPTVLSIEEDDDDIVAVPAVIARKTSSFGVGIQPLIGKSSARSLLRPSLLNRQRTPVVSENSDLVTTARAPFFATPLLPKTSAIGGHARSSNKNSAILLTEDEKDIYEFPSGPSDVAVLPVRASTPVSPTLAPTHTVRNLGEALEAVSPKKQQENAASVYAPASPARKRIRFPSDNSTRFTLTADSKPDAQEETTNRRKVGRNSERENKSNVDINIKQVEKEFNDLKTQLCSGKVKEEVEEWEEEEDKEKLRQQLQREQSFVAEIQQNIDKMITFVDLFRPSQSAASTDTSFISSPVGRPNFKKFKKAAQGRFNNTLLSASPSAVVLAGQDLVDFRQLREI